MQREEVDEIIRCLPSGKTYFYYFPDRYAFLLLSYLVGGGMLTKEIKASAFAKLLSKPSVQSAIANVGGTMLSREVFDSRWPAQSECYLLSLGRWGSGDRAHDQISRKGHNLVLQLNFSSKHNRPYEALIQPDESHPFEYRYHPIADHGYHTLAWCRLDLDLKAGEALIEEIQNDWLRYALRSRAVAESGDESRIVEFRGSRIPVDKVKRYVDHVLSPHLKIWDEAMLTAAIWFLREELGIKRVFYHTYESGAALKGIRGRLPPRSLYTTLPKKFCFVTTREKPSFLESQRTRRKRRSGVDEAQFQLLTWER
jgi:hypothetical protein